MIEHYARSKSVTAPARIVVVDDDINLLRATSRLLKGAGYEVLEAATGVEGLQLAKEMGPDLVLLDVMLGDMDGLEVCERIKADTDLAGSYVILLSPITPTDNQANGLEAGADGYITRPISNRELLVYVEAMLRLKRAEDALQERTHQLDERVKELNCLYGISQLVEKPDASLEEILQGTAHLIPPAWQYPEITVARITLDGQEFKTDNFQETTWLQSRDIKVCGEPAGTVEVYYLEERPEIDEGPFLREERKLLNAIAERLGRITERVRAEEALREGEEMTRALLNAPTDLAVLLEPDGTIVALNESMAKGLGQRPDELIGRNAYEFLSTELTQGRQPRLEEVIQLGRPARFEDTRAGRWYDNHLYPVFDAQGWVKLVALYSCDITERRQVEQALQGAKEVAEAARYEEQQRRWEAERRRQIAEGLGDVLAALNSNQPLEEVLDLIATQARRLLDARAVGIYSLGAELGTLAVEASKGLLVTYVAGSEIPIGQESLRQSMVSRRPVAVPDVATFPTDAGVLAADVRRQASAGSWANLYRAWLAVPIVSKAEVYGGMLLYYAEPRVFFEDEVELAVAFADQAALAIENSRLRAQIEQAAVSAERDRLARDLHDAVTQTLFSASLIAEAMPRVWESNPEEGRRGLEELRQLTRGALAEMRTLLVELRPAALTEKPMDELLRHLTEATTGRTRVPVALTVDGDTSLQPDLQIALYRIAQEALNNVARHAGASQASVSLNCRLGYVTLHISDDGRGFDPDDILPDRLGMGSMRERAAAIGAELEIKSQLGSGTQVTVDWRDAQEEGV
jgi:PAS domain S-box-containing protein